MGRATDLSLRPIQFLHTPAFRSLCKAGDDKLPVMKSLRQRLQRREGEPVGVYPCLFCGGPEEDVPHMVLCFWSLNETQTLQGILLRMGEYLPPRERGLWFLSWVQHGREFLGDFVCGVFRRDMDRQLRWSGIMWSMDLSV